MRIQFNDYSALFKLLIACLIAVLIDMWDPESAFLRVAIQFSCFTPIAWQSVVATKRENTRRMFQRKVFERLRQALIGDLIRANLCTQNLSCDNISVRLFYQKTVMSVPTHFIGIDRIGWHSYPMSNWGSVALDKKRDKGCFLLKVSRNQGGDLCQAKHCIGKCSDRNNSIFEETQFIAAFVHGDGRYIVCFDSKSAILRAGYNKNEALQILKSYSQQFFNIYLEVEKGGGVLD